MDERFCFEVPSAEREADIIEYLEEFRAARSEIHGSGSLDRVLEGWSFEQALDRCLNMADADYARRAERCPGRTFLLIRAGDGRLVGTINIRWDLTDEMLRFAGHIGYGIRPSERRKGYNRINLYLGLKEARKLGLDRVMLGCSVSNTASDRTIRALGGILERCETDPEDGEPTNVYRIDVNGSLEKYAPVYERYVYGPGDETDKTDPAVKGTEK